jgi:hypothetical protein
MDLNRHVRLRLNFFVTGDGEAPTQVHVVISDLQIYIRKDCVVGRSLAEIWNSTVVFLISWFVGRYCEMMRLRPRYFIPVQFGFGDAFFCI